MLGFILLVFFTISFGKEAWRSYQIKREVTKLENEISSLDKKNGELKNLAQYFNTDLFREKEARLKLNLQKPGETVVAIPDEYLGSNEQEEEALAQSDNANNPRRWFQYFFDSYATNNL